MCLMLYVSLQMPKVLRGLGCILEVYLEGSICSISQRNLSYTYLEIMDLLETKAWQQNH